RLPGACPDFAALAIAAAGECGSAESAAAARRYISRRLARTRKTALTARLLAGPRAARSADPRREGRQYNRADAAGVAALGLDPRLQTRAMAADRRRAAAKRIALLQIRSGQYRRSGRQIQPAGRGALAHALRG